MQVYGSPFAPVGSAEFVGAGAVVALGGASPTTPTNSGGFGKTIATIEAALNLGKLGNTPDRIVRSMTFSVEGGSIHILTTGSIPTVAIGVAYAAGTYEWENDAARIHGFQAWVPVGVTLNVEYGA